MRILVVVPIRGVNQMFLTEYNSTKMQREPAVVFDAALKEPIIITRMKHDGVVMLSKQAYARLVKNQK